MKVFRDPKVRWNLTKVPVLRMKAPVGFVVAGSKFSMKVFLCNLHWQWRVAAWLRAHSNGGWASIACLRIPTYCMKLSLLAHKFSQYNVLNMDVTKSDYEYAICERRPKRLLPKFCRWGVMEVLLGCMGIPVSGSHFSAPFSVVSWARLVLPKTRFNLTCPHLYQCAEERSLCRISGTCHCGCQVVVLCLVSHK